MGYGDPAYVYQQIFLLRQRLLGEGVSDDLINACLLDEAAYGFANGKGPELMPPVFREVADDMEAGKYKIARSHQTRPVLTLLPGGRTDDQR